ncbi:CLP protease proteolytic subunit 2 [Hibiscus syriacus]|uniref:CLP protease proteolytic subunit 2 n=1 Tax=Hibiscus syriacus TaxID=106335 RepID=A0A6A3CYD2_HIBSY|nr:CLP protease proteolytic subunit 2 [Hibiscus syriacus]
MLLHRVKSLLSNQLTIKQAKQIHAQILIFNLKHLQPLLVHQFLLSKTSYSASVFVYVREILHRLRKPDAFSWGCTIRFLSQRGKFHEAFSLYVEMQKLGLYPSTHDMSSALRACARTESKTGGISIYAQSHRYERVFDEMPKKDVISWNLILSGYAKTGNMDQTLSFFQHMPEKSFDSWNTLISGYIEHGELESARRFFDMIAGYTKCGDIKSARELFDKMPEKDHLAFNAIISCYAQNSQPKEALKLFDEILKSGCAINGKADDAIKLFRKMVDAQIQPNLATFTGLLTAYNHAGLVE